MNTSEFTCMVESSSLASYRDFFQRHVRPAVDIMRIAGLCEIGSSKFGGSPDLPRGMRWPEHRLGPYRFIAQFDFAKVGQHVLLPSSGLLSIFQAYDHGVGEFFFGDAGYIHAILTPAGTDLVPVLPPAEMRLGGQCAVVFRPTLDIPYDEDQVADWPFGNADKECYDTLRGRLHAAEDYLLGWPRHATLAYDPSPGEGWLAFLNLGSNDELDWCWSDGDRLMLFVEQSQLAAECFDVLKAEEG